MEKKPSIGDWEGRGDGSYRLYTGEPKGWIICDDHKDLQEELLYLTNGKVRPSYGNEEG